MPTPPSPPTAPYDRRRQHARIALRMSAEVHVGDSSFTATSRDLSEGGCGLELKQSLPEGSEITLGLFMVIDDVEEERVPPLWVKGRVVWTSEMDDEKSQDKSQDKSEDKSEIKSEDAVHPAPPARWMAGVRFEVITEQQKIWVRQVLAHLAPVINAR